MFYIFRDTVRV